MKLCYTNKECGGMCCVLIGDTVHWIDKRSCCYLKAVPESKGYHSSTQRAIIERVLLNWGPNGPGGCLVALAPVVCDLPGELEIAIHNINRYELVSFTTNLY